MVEESSRFNAQEKPYMKNYNISFEFAYNLRKLRIELNRGNYIYAIQMLETLRNHTLTLQVLNENKKLHQFKAYHTLQNEFLVKFQKSYPNKIDNIEIADAADVLTQLFQDVLIKNDTFTMDAEVFRIAEI